MVCFWELHHNTYYVVVFRMGRGRIKMSASWTKDIDRTIQGRKDHSDEFALCVTRWTHGESGHTVSVSYQGKDDGRGYYMVRAKGDRRRDDLEYTEPTRASAESAARDIIQNHPDGIPREGDR